MPRSALLCLVPLLVGCSLQKLAVKQTAGILRQSLPAFETEWDFELVEESLPSTVKVVEGFLQADQGNHDLLLLTSQAYASLALVVLEDRLERAAEDSPEADRLLVRTREMYLRAHRYALRLLDRRHPGFLVDFGKDQESLERRLRECGAEDVPGLFWAGMPLASAVNLSRDDVTMVSLVPRARALVARALELEEGYYHAGGHMVFGGLYGSMGRMLGGDPDKARRHFERALALTRRRFLMVQVMYAKTLAVQLQDRRLFESLLGEVLKADLSIFPEQKLANVAAKRRARRLLARVKELF
jgi:predicted anti-sigma-YlaC factor YlaD